MHATAAASTHGHPVGAGALCQLSPCPCIPVPCPARTLSPRLVSSAYSQCTSSDGWSGHAQAVRYPRSVDRLARTGRCLTRVRRGGGSFSPDSLPPPLAAPRSSFLPPFRHGPCLLQYAQ